MHYVGLFNGNGISVAIGAGIALYGFAYALVHELFIHQRLPVLKKSRFVIGKRFD
jgi:beta-carotene 3-hydroxylase